MQRHVLIVSTALGALVRQPRHSLCCAAVASFAYVYVFAPDIVCRPEALLCTCGQFCQPSAVPRAVLAVAAQL